MTPDERVVEILPALREFVEAVNDRDLDVLQASLQHSPPATLAILAAGWIGDLLDQVDALTEGNSALERSYAGALADVARTKKAFARSERDLMKANKEHAVTLRRVTKLQGDLYIKRETEKE